jgi:hypothetical protein
VFWRTSSAKIPKYSTNAQTGKAASLPSPLLTTADLWLSSPGVQDPGETREVRPDELLVFGERLRAADEAWNMAW